jgi:tetraacyldisaccharide 4'-kinase
MTPLELIYAAALRARNARYDRQEPARLKWPVVSVGNLSVGGAGKTPLVIRLAQLLAERGFAPDVLSRGYGRTGKVAERVNVKGDAERFGDEPLLIARAAHVPVFVGASRYAAGMLAELGETGAARRVHLLDDGFQHRQLARDLDIVLLTEEDVRDGLLPAGNLREPLSALRRADVIVMRVEEEGSLRGFVASLMEGREAPAIWTVERRLSLGEAGEIALPSLPLAFSGIARPDNFAKMLNTEGCMPVERIDFADHHRYDDRDVATLLERARHKGANGFVTTEKDAVKLTPLMTDRLEAVGPVVVTRLSVELIDEAGAMKQLVERVGRLDRRRR